MIKQAFLLVWYAQRISIGFFKAFYAMRPFAKRPLAGLLIPELPEKYSYNGPFM
ncbi:MAG: hypothetical protein OXD29_08790 [Roseovarius sp.]|nr:hypothetical protein [Roseovarius sp.]